MFEVFRKGAIASLALTVTLTTGVARAGEEWKPIPQENLLYMEISGGTVVIEMYPEAAPDHAARIKELTRAGFYDGLTFHRVIDDFMAQTGDPLGTGEGGSDKPDIKAEFTFHHDPAAPSFGKDRVGATVGMLGSAIILTEPEAMQYSRADGRLQSWLPQCRGAVAMARASNQNSANSQFYIMFSDTHRDALDRQYTAWGHVIQGMGIVDRAQRGEPPGNPTRIYKMRVGSDLPEQDRINFEDLSPTSQAMKDLLDAAQARAHGRLNVCEIEIPVRIAPKTEETP